MHWREQTSNGYLVRTDGDERGSVQTLRTRDSSLSFGATQRRDDLSPNAEGLTPCSYRPARRPG